MKKLLYILLCIIFSVSCKDKLAEDGNEIVEGKPVTVSLSIGVEDRDKVDSRLAQPDAVEKNIVEFFAIAFNSDGTLSGSAAFSTEDVKQMQENNNIIRFSMTSGRNKKIFLVANYNSSIGMLENAEGRQVSIEEIGSLEEFRKLCFKLSHGNELMVDRAVFVMTGEMKPANGSSSIDVDTSGNITGAQTSTGGKAMINLERLDARINFELVTQKDAERFEKLTFEPYYYKVVNIPQGSYLVGQEKDWGENVSEDKKNEAYASMKNTDEHRNLDDVNMNGTSRFSFYMMESRLDARKRIKTTDTSSATNGGTAYALREKKDQIPLEHPNPNGQEYKLGDWTYAPKYGAYVVIYGRIQGKLLPNFEEGKEVFADVKLYIHLGETKNWKTNENALNNYDTRRNVQYTYRVIITGLHSLHVEVDWKDERRPGMEGDLVMSSDGKLFDLDAHYCTTVFKLNVKAWENDNPPVSWAISTPYQRVMKVLDKSAFDNEGNIIPGKESLLKTDLSMNDYKWIKFAINRECGYGDSEIVRFPGESFYDGGSYDITSTSGQAPVLGKEKSRNTFYGKEFRLYDVNQLMNRLYQLFKQKDKTGTDGNRFIDSNGDIVITAFVDEFLYTYNPTKHYYAPPTRATLTAEEKVLWKTFVNETNRWLYLSTDSKFSPDGNTTRAKAIVVFSQHPIHTIFNAKKTDTAWGTETIAEQSHPDYKDGQIGYEQMQNGNWNNYPNDRVNGRMNSVHYLTRWKKGLKWQEVLDYTGMQGAETFKQQTLLQENYRNVNYTPMMRNRDFNGNGIVDEEEIRWYLASVDQLTAHWIGRSSLSRAKLYDQNKYASSTDPKAEVSRVHYIASTFIKTPGVPYKLWAEEGASLGGANESENIHITPRFYFYKCARNMGVQAGEKPKSYINWDRTRYPIGGQGYEYRIDMSRLDDNNLRSPFDNTLIPANTTERDPAGNNRTSKGFAVLLTQQDGKEADYPLDGQGFFFISADYNNIMQNEGKIIEFPDPEKPSSKNYNICPPGYRIPNHSELLIMHSLMKDEIFKNSNTGTNYGAKAVFSFKGKSPYGLNRLGFATYGVNFILLTSNNNILRFRCVRDININN